MAGEVFCLMDAGYPVTAVFNKMVQTFNIGVFLIVSSLFVLIQRVKPVLSIAPALFLKSAVTFSETHYMIYCSRYLLPVILTFERGRAALMAVLMSRTQSITVVISSWNQPFQRGMVNMKVSVFSVCLFLSLRWEIRRQKRGKGRMECKLDFTDVIADRGTWKFFL